MQHQDALQRKLPERIFHAVCFEGIATAILAPTAAWLMQRSVVEMGGLTIILATTAMLWNIIYNFGFDRFLACPARKTHGKSPRAACPGVRMWVYRDWRVDCRCGSWRHAAAGIHAGNRFLPVLPALHHVLQLGV